MADQNNLLFTVSDSTVKEIYRNTLAFPFKFQSSIGDQLRRSSLSVVLNIVEAGARRYPKERMQLLNVAFESLKETKYLCEFAYEFKLITLETLNKCTDSLNTIAKLLYGILYRSKS